MIRGTDISIGEIYHIYNRGVDKKIIFRDKSDRRRFIKLLYLCNNTERIELRAFKDRPVFDMDISNKIVSIGSYCLMDNHFHLLLKETTEGGITKFISKLCGAYVMYFNKKYNRAGTLFGCRFHAKHCSSDAYLKYLFAYIHLNPIKIINPKWKETGIKDINKTKTFLLEYKHSSFIDYFEPRINRAEKKILNISEFPDYFRDEEFNKHIDYWMRFKNICENI